MIGTMKLWDMEFLEGIQSLQQRQFEKGKFDGKRWRCISYEKTGKCVT